MADQPVGYEVRKAALIADFRSNLADKPGGPWGGAGQEF